MELEKKYTWSKQLEIQSQDVDGTSLLTMHAFMCLAQEAAHQHSTHLGFGYEVLFNKQLIWVLSRFKSRVFRMPRWQEKVIFKTWHKGGKGIFFIRDYELLSETGELLIAATSSWLIIDINLRKIVRANDVVYELGAADSVIHKDILSPFVKKIPIPNNLEFCYNRKVRFSDIDMNGHVNNARYSEWVMDTLSLENVFLDGGKQISNFELTLNNEAYLNEEIAIYINSENLNYCIVGKNQDKIIFQCHIELVK